ncbi:MAG: ABC transporter permease subunit [Opitutales bacterium]
MRKFNAIFSNQLYIMFMSPSTYVAAVLFTVFMAFVYMLSLVSLSENASAQAPTAQFLSIFPVPVLFIIPILTMRSIAEEKKLGTLDSLLTTPVSVLQVVLAKFFACYFYYIALWALTLLFPILTKIYLPNSMTAGGIFSMQDILSGYSFILISGLSYIAIGIFASSLTRTTLVAAMLSFFMLFCILIAGGVLSSITIPDAPYLSWVATLAEYTQSFRHLEDFNSTLVDTRPLFLYISVSVLFLSITTINMNIKR